MLLKQRHESVGKAVGAGCSRREFVYGAAAFAGALALAPAQARAKGGQPNILVIMTDQQTASAMSCAGNPHVKTPALDALAARGTRFSQAYVVQPLCTPFRSSLQTGRYPHEIGVVCNGLDISGEFPMLGSCMRAAGYETAYIGKWHVGASLEAAGYPSAKDPRPDDRKTEAAVAFLQARHADPFFLTASFLNPHNVCQLARGQVLPDGPIGDAPAALDDLPPLPDNFAVPPLEPSSIRPVQLKSPEQYPTRDWDERRWRQYLWGYYRLVEKVDAEIGQVLDALESSVYADNTQVLFVSDHGEGMAMHQWNQKQILYDQCVRVPFIMAGPGIVSGAVSSELVSPALDIPRTVLEFAGAAPPASMRGASLCGLATGTTAALSRNYVASETVFAQNTERLGLSGRMLRTRQFKYCLYDVGEPREQLFDMDHDPGETKNLIFEPSFQGALEEHRRLMKAWALETNDRDFPHLLV